MKRIIVAVLVLLLPPNVGAQTPLPWPSVAMGQIYLPFGTEWFQEGARDRVTGFGEPECSPETCRWMADRAEGTVFLTQSYHAGTLVGFRLDYTLTRESGAPYLEKVRELRERMGEEWVVTSLLDPLSTAVVPEEDFRAESKDTRIQVTYREGEHAVTVTLDIQAK